MGAEATSRSLSSGSEQRRIQSQADRHRTDEAAYDQLTDTGTNGSMRKGKIWLDDLWFLAALFHLPCQARQDSDGSPKLNMLTRVGPVDTETTSHDAGQLLDSSLQCGATVQCLKQARTRGPCLAVLATLGANEVMAWVAARRIHTRIDAIKSLIQAAANLNLQ